MEDKIIGFKINSKGYGIVPKLLTQDRNICIGAKGLYSYFCSFTGGGDTCFPSRSKICFDLCISVDTFTRYLKQLVEHGYIKVEQVKENGRFSHNVYTLCDTITPCPKISDTENTVSEISVYGKSYTNNNNINNNNINNKERKKERAPHRKNPTQKVTSLPDVTKSLPRYRDREKNKDIEKESTSSVKKTTTKETFNELIDNYTDNEQLRNELKEHLKTRKTKKATLTNHAIELSLKKLDSITTNDNEKILIVQNAIENGWTTFYPLRKIINNQTSTNYSSYDIDEYEKYSIFDK